MNREITKEQVKRIRITSTEIAVELLDGRIGKEEIKKFPALRNAGRKALENFTAGTYGIRWEQFDEDLSYTGFFQPSFPNAIAEILKENPVLNASSVARRLGYSPSLLAQYVSGAKRPSPERTKAILNEIRKIGRELAAI